MIDASHEPFEENVATTRRVVDRAHEKERGSGTRPLRRKRVAPLNLVCLALDENDGGRLASCDLHSAIFARIIVHSAIDVLLAESFFHSAIGLESGSAVQG